MVQRSDAHPEYKYAWDALGGKPNSEAILSLLTGCNSSRHGACPACTCHDERVQALDRVLRRLQRLLLVQRVVAVLGLASTMLLGAWAVHPTRVYESQVYVVFLPPESVSTNPLLHNGTLITTAGIVGGSVNAGNRAPQPTLDTIPLSSTGVEHGYLVTVPNSGSQWVYQFEVPQLHVQATGTSPEESLATLQSVLWRIDQELAVRQIEAGSPSREMIRTELSPAVPTTAMAAGSRSRAGLAALLIGLVLTATATRLARRLSPTRRWLRSVLADRASSAGAGSAPSLP